MWRFLVVALLKGAVVRLKIALCFFLRERAYTASQ